MTIIFSGRIRRQHHFGGGVPKRTLDALDAYVQDGLLPGGFLVEVLSDRLMGAVHLADDDNLKVLPAIVWLIYNELPAECRGNRAKVAGWIEKKYAEKAEREKQCQHDTSSDPG